jgi:hypothetical protein
MIWLKTILVLSLLFFTIGCGEDKKFPIKVFETPDGYYEWYYYSLITSDGPDYIDFIDKDCERTLIYEGHNIIDIEQKKGELFVECFECDTIEFNPLYKNQIHIIKNDDYMDFSDALLIRDSLKRNVKVKRCD